MPVRYNREDASVGGAIPEGDYRFSGSHFEQGKTARGFDSIVFVADLLNELTGATYDRRWSCGDPQSFAPGENGQTLEAIGQREQLSSSCQFMEMVASLEDAGYPPDQRTFQAGHDFDGMLVHLIPKQAEERTGLDKRDRPEVIYVVTEIKELPWEAKPKAQAPGTRRPPGAPTYRGATATRTAPAAPATRPTPPRAPAAASPDGPASAEVIEKLVALIVETVEEGGGAAPVTAVRTRLFQRLRDDQDRPIMSSLLTDVAFLAALAEQQGIVQDDRNFVRA